MWLTHVYRLFDFDFRHFGTWYDSRACVGPVDLPVDVTCCHARWCPKTLYTGTRPWALPTERALGVIYEDIDVFLEGGSVTTYGLDIIYQHTLLPSEH